MTVPRPSWQPRQREAKADPISAWTRTVIIKRAGGQCELGCGRRGSHAHHRQLRRGGNHGASNLLWIDLLCHRRIHGHVAESEAAGWLVSQYTDPAAQAVALGGAWWLLADDGSKAETVPPPA